jgi:putative aldouronate transport system permease protein
MTAQDPVVIPRQEHRDFALEAGRIWSKNWRLYLLVLPALTWLAVFMYAPLYGVLIAFKDFKPRVGIMGSPWAGLKYFEQFFSTNVARNLITNTLMLSLQQLIFFFPVPIIFALLLNQITGRRYKKFIQTISYAPYFISNVVIVSIMMVILAPGGGFVNIMLQRLGSQPIFFMSMPEYFRPLYIASTVWQMMGFNAMIYIAALTSISPDYYEAAMVDGALKYQRVLHIDLPLIAPTIIVMFILAVGNLMTIGYEKAFLMQSGMNLRVSEIISTFVYKTGLVSAQFSFATAVGLFNSIVNFILLVTTNTISKRVSDTSLF